MTHAQELLRQWFGRARWIYSNWSLELVKAQTTKLDLKLKTLRAAIVNNGNYRDENTWVVKTPYEVRDGAMVDLVNAYKTNFAKRRKNKDHTFEIGVHPTSVCLVF